MKSSFIISSLILGLGAANESVDFYIVGDSLSDNGNTWPLTGGRRPNGRLFPEHKYTNGLVWNEYLVKKYPNLNLKNYAIGDATTDNDVLNLEYDSPSFKDQALKISADLSKPTPKKCGSNKDNKKFAIIWTGGNDFIANATIASKTIIPNLLKVAGILKDTKKFDNILVFNLIDLFKSPFGNTLPADQKEALSQGINQLNQLLVKSIQEEQAKNPSQKLTYFDVSDIINTLISTPPKNVTKWNPLKTCVDKFNPETSEICKNPQDSFFYDIQHPNTLSHERIANELGIKFKQLNLF